MVGERLSSTSNNIVIATILILFIIVLYYTYSTCATSRTGCSQRKDSYAVYPQIAPYDTPCGLNECRDGMASANCAYAHGASGTATGATYAGQRRYYSPLTTDRIMYGATPVCNERDNRAVFGGPYGWRASNYY